MGTRKSSPYVSSRLTAALRDWGLLVFFVGLFLIVGGAENAGIVGKFLGIAEHWNLHKLGVFTVAVSLLSNIVSNVPAVMWLEWVK